ncbi:MAG: hypothetical protein GY815_12520 [Gammaproteobacteria bacterium]|nr:hypothetical protein [Gammaproteobacteria bacterium]
MKLGVFDEQYFADICELDVDPLFVLENEAVAADGLLPVSRALGLTGL